MQPWDVAAEVVGAAELLELKLAELLPHPKNSMAINMIGNILHMDPRNKWDFDGQSEIVNSYNDRVKYQYSRINKKSVPLGAYKTPKISSAKPVFGGDKMASYEN